MITVRRSGSGPARDYRINLSDPLRERADRFWAMLITAAIITTFVGLVSFYTLIRLIIIKPLRSLREVSEAISTATSPNAPN